MREIHRSVPDGNPTALSKVGLPGFWARSLTLTSGSLHSFPSLVGTRHYVRGKYSMNDMYAVPPYRYRSPHIPQEEGSIIEVNRVSKPCTYSLNSQNDILIGSMNQAEHRPCDLSPEVITSDLLRPIIYHQTRLLHSTPSSYLPPGPNSLLAINFYHFPYLQIPHPPSVSPSKICHRI